MQYDHEAYRACIFGQSGTGKTTLFLRVLHGLQASKIFLYDPEDEFQKKLGIGAAVNLQGCIDAVKRPGWCIYSNREMFSTDPKAGAEWFAHFAFLTSQKLPGRKILAMDELQNFASHGDLREVKEKRDGQTVLRKNGLALVLNQGRRFGLDFVAIAQAPNVIDFNVRRQLTEAVCFFIPGQDRNAVDYCTAMGFDPETVTHLPGGSYVVRNLKTGAVGKGKVF